MDTTTPLQHLVAELIGIGGQLTTTLDHMYRTEAASHRTDLEPVPVVLARLLEDILAEPSGSFSHDELHGAARVLRTASTAIENDLFLVAPPNRAARRTQRRGGCA